ncbi:hypothetical protein RSOLAG22IIIB_11739 [Rhizoctonia solani]|uniref:HNH nuclease domain-containing protein n=1 Tax=Rhizoctonia solani TaxID=456999 RepID=A0A0K6GA24_9AGAM|nr:hypothetical protein RSOLAG22IIIB_11739 [Rhizoctonia solani]
MFATPLPLDCQFEDAVVRSAYERVLPLEEHNLVHIRILGYMLIHAPDENGRLNIAHDINNCATDQDVLELGKSIFKFFAQYFTFIDIMKSRSPHIDYCQIEGSSSVTPTPGTYSEAKNNALVRDNYRCMLTGIVDATTYDNRPALREQLGNNPPPNVDETECWHILPQYIISDIHSDQEKRIDCPAIFKVLERFGGISYHEIIKHGVHHWSNLMTVQLDLLASLNRLQVWLDPVKGLENTYTIGRRHPGIRPDVSPTIIFTASAPTLPLPDRRYLALHAACAKVAHLSGASEAISLLGNKQEHDGVLSEDGSSAEILENRLSVHVILAT